MKLDSALTGMMSAPPVLLPVFALLSVWMWNAAQNRSPAGVCVDSGIIFIDALAQYGIKARLEPVQVSICDGHEEIVAQYGSDPRWNADATFNGHAVITLPGIGRFADATVQQFSEIPASDQARLPLIAPMPSSAGLGTEPFVVHRIDHGVIYQGFPGDYQHLWRHPVVEAHRDGFHFAAANLAANVFDILRSEHLAPNVRQALYPRLHQLLDELTGAQSLVEEGKYAFRHPITKRLIQLADIPFADGYLPPRGGG